MGLVAWYKLEETNVAAGAPAADETGNHPGIHVYDTLHSPPDATVQAVAGHLGKGMSVNVLTTYPAPFDDFRAGVNVPSIIGFGGYNSSFACSFWIKWGGAYDPVYPRGVLGCTQNLLSGPAGWRFGINQLGKFYFTVGGTLNAPNTVIFGALPSGRFVNVIGVYSATTKLARLYIGGALRGTKLVTSFDSPVNSSFQIGGAFVSFTVSFPSFGNGKDIVLDEVKLYDTDTVLPGRSVVVNTVLGRNGPIT